MRAAGAAAAAAAHARALWRSGSAPRLTPWNAAEEAGKVASVFHNRRWDSDFLALREVLRSGRIGRAVELQSAFDRFRPTVRARWREGAGPGAGLWAE